MTGGKKPSIGDDRNKKTSHHAEAIRRLVEIGLKGKK